MYYEGFSIFAALFCSFLLYSKKTFLRKPCFFVYFILSKVSCFSFGVLSYV